MSDGPEKRSAYDWAEYGRAVLNDLARITRDIDAINEKITKIRTEDLAQFKTDIALLKFQAALWGTVGGGAVTAIITAVVKGWGK